MSAKWHHHLPHPLLTACECLGVSLKSPPHSGVAPDQPHPHTAARHPLTPPLLPRCGTRSAASSRSSPTSSYPSPPPPQVRHQISLILTQQPDILFRMEPEDTIKLAGGYARAKVMQFVLSNTFPLCHSHTSPWAWRWLVLSPRATQPRSPHTLNPPPPPHMRSQTPYPI